MRMTSRNLQNIKSRFEEKTGTRLSRNRYPVRKLLILAAAVMACLIMAAFAYPLFTPLDGDKLALSAVYEGNGIVSIQVENDSDKPLKFEEQVKLVSWILSEEVEQQDGTVHFDRTEFAAHSAGVMTVDLSEAYDIEALENSQWNQEWYYILLTNNSFLFGHDWMCSICFGKAEDIAPEEAESLVSIPVEPAIMENIEEELRFYFEESYSGQPPAFNGANFEYLQKVQQFLLRCKQRIVSSADTALIAERLPENVILDDSYPKELQCQLIGQHTRLTDGFGRMVGASDSETALTLSVLLPHRKQDRGSGVYMPLIYLFTYPVEEIQSEEDCAFIYGQLYTFAELEQFKIYEDAKYAVYEVTDLMYTDLEAYTAYFLSTEETTIYYDEDIRARIENAYAYFKDQSTLGELMHYHLPGLCDEIPAE